VPANIQASNLAADSSNAATHRRQQVQPQSMLLLCALKPPLPAH
jgi:hypothetical protein